MNLKKRNSWMINYMAILSLLCIFIVGSLILMNVGVHVYKNIVESNGQNFRLRSSLSYVATKVRQYDKTDAICVEEKDGIQMLVLKEQIDGVEYETRIYSYDGALRELFQEKGMEYKPADGLEIMEIMDFQVEKDKNHLLFTAIDQNEQENLQITLKSEQ